MSCKIDQTRPNSQKPSEGRSSVRHPRGVDQPAARGHNQLEWVHISGLFGEVLTSIKGSWPHVWHHMGERFADVSFVGQLAQGGGVGGGGYGLGRRLTAITGAFY